MNAEGDLAKQTKDIGEQTAKDATSDEALKSYTIINSTNQQNISTIPVITRDDILKQHLR
jgi:hypothetical protein